MLQLSPYAPPPRQQAQPLKANNSQRVGNQLVYKRSKTRIDPELEKALKGIIPNKYLDLIGYLEWTANLFNKDTILKPKEAQTLAAKIQILNELNVTKEMLQDFVNSNILKEEFIRSIKRWIPTTLVGLALSLNLNVNTVISMPILYTLGTMMQTFRSNSIRKGLEVVKRNAFK